MHSGIQGGVANEKASHNKQLIYGMESGICGVLLRRSKSWHVVCCQLLWLASLRGLPPRPPQGGQVRRDFGSDGPPAPLAALSRSTSPWPWPVKAATEDGAAGATSTAATAGRRFPAPPGRRRGRRTTGSGRRANTSTPHHQQLHLERFHDVAATYGLAAAAADGFADFHDDDDAQFGLVGPVPNPPPPAAGVAAADEADAPRPHGTLSSKIVADPPRLAEWRARLFNVDELIVLTNDE